MDIAAAKKRCEAASGGTWTPSTDGLWLWTNSMAHLANHPGDTVLVFTTQGKNLEQDRANINFAAGARSDLPAALEALEVAWGREKVMRESALEIGCQLEEARKSAGQAWQWYNREAKTAGELIHAASERDEAQGKLEAVERWSDKWPWSGLLGEAKRELDRILRGSKEDE